MKEFLAELGMNAGLIVAGLFGSLLTLRGDAAKRLGSVMVSLGTGVGSANYLTPVVIDLLGVQSRNLEFGIAFILGYLGLNGIDFLARRLFESKKP
jgi:hypothetical protein